MTWRRAVVAGAATAAVVLAGCGGGRPDTDPAEALAAAKAALDQAGSVRIRLTGKGLPDTGTVVLEATGTAAHPPAFDGTIRLSRDGLPISVDVVSVDGTVYAKLPLTDTFTKVDAAALGVTDPAQLMDPESGVSQLLVADPSPEADGEVRVEGEVLDEYAATLPGPLVGELLGLADLSADVTARFAIEPDTSRPRRAVLTGPFFGDADATYTLLLDDYGDPVEIRAPIG